jgi:HEAT repeat protein
MAPLNKEANQKPRSTILWISVAAAFGTVLMIAALLKPDEPTYEGKRLYNWLIDLSYGRPQEREKARAALRAMGEPAAAHLTGMLEKEDSPIKERLQDYVSDIPVLNTFATPAESYHALAANGLAEIGPTAKSAIPALTKIAEGSSYLAKYKARAALMIIRQESISSLGEILANRDSTNWMAAASTARELGTNARPLIPLLVSASEHTNWMVRATALGCLGELGLEPEVSIPALLKGLQDAERYVRQSAVFAFHNWPAAASEHQEALLTCLNDSDNYVRLMTVLALQTITENLNTNRVIPAVAPLLNDPDANVRNMAKALFDELVSP